MGSRCIYPYRDVSTIYSSNFKELKASADMGYKAFVRLGDFTSQAEIEHSFKDSNTVINMIGSRIFFEDDDEFEEANIHVPITIAKAAKNNPNIKRFIHFSAAGADPNSHSKRLRTKWIAE